MAEACAFEVMNKTCAALVWKLQERLQHVGSFICLGLTSDWKLQATMLRMLWVYWHVQKEPELCSVAIHIRFNSILLSESSSLVSTSRTC